MKTSRSGKPAETAPEGVSPPADVSPPKVEKKYEPQMGDTVLFNYKAPSARAAITVPLVITKVHNDYQTIDGVALNSNNTGGSMGAICVHGILPGKGEFEWRVR